MDFTLQNSGSQEHINRPSTFAEYLSPHHPQSHSYLNHGDSEEEREDVYDPMSIDPELRLRTVKTAHSVIAESIQSEALAEKREKRRRLFNTMKKKASGISIGTLKRKTVSSETSAATSIKSRRGTIATVATDDSPPHLELVLPSLAEPPEQAIEKSRGKKKGKKKELPRRTVFVNIPLPSYLLDNRSEPIIRYVRNKVRTSKYTIVTFVPKNLFEQFRRVANIYFLFLVILQVFPIFGAPNPQIGMLPLIAILGMTAIKDAIEDWRRAKLDNEVNNSATTKLAGWNNVNQPRDPRSLFEKLFGLGSNPDKPTKGVKKLREREALHGNQLAFDTRKDEEQDPIENTSTNIKESYPLGLMPSVGLPSASVTSSPYDTPRPSLRRELLQQRKSSSSLPSTTSRRSIGVTDWTRPSSGSSQWERTLWKKLEVGDLVLLRDNEQVPADIIVLSTSNADSLCFVETKNLDGETNLKIRRALKATNSISSEEDLEHAHFVIDSEPPHANLYSYNGVLKYNPVNESGKRSEEKQEAITINELLLRGCTLRNTKWVIGIVVFTGADTKIMLNGGETPSKRSKIEKETSNNVAMNFVILVVLCLVTSFLHAWYRSLTGTSADWYEPGAEASNNIYLDSVIIFFSCLLVFMNIVPISLYITVEVVKTIQAFFIFQDQEMYYEAYDTPCVPKTWNISDDLGQIEYVFSDKTGTLTQNIMEFKRCSIQGVSFGEGLTEAMMGARKGEGEDIEPAMMDQKAELMMLKEKMLRKMKKTVNNRYLQEDKLTFIAPDLVEHLEDLSDPMRPHIVSFFSALAVCHSVLSDTPDPVKPYILDYKAESPDEAALVAAARDIGFPFITKNSRSLEIEVLGTRETWIPLRMLEFNSSRKRMSVVTRGPDGRIVLFCKGADSVIYERLNVNHDPDLKQATLKDLETFANGGLRTLCIAYRYLSEEEFNEWAQKYDAACAATVDREGEIDKASELIEHSLTILGATALEDKLQEGVPASIAMLHQAGIKLWILTGDKLQTAIEIGYSCNLLTNDMEVMIVSADSEEGCRQQIEAGLNKIASVIGPPPVTPKGKKLKPDMNIAAEFAVVIDGQSLGYALQPSLKSLFLSLGTQCKAVICCRVSPSQKALTVRLVKEGCQAMTLSIGDGANDVAMIQEANVGVGLYGLEGSQAAMSADYAFGQFRFLTRLLLVHGRWSYVRIAKMHANFFYKNVIWTVSMFWFLIFSSFDATYLFEYTFLLLYNLVFTSLPVGIMGAFDQDVNAAASLNFPQLYKSGIAGLEYTRTRFWLYMVDGLYQSAVIFFIPYLAYGAGESWSHTGRDTNSLWEFGTAVAAAGVLAANGYVGINSKYWTVITWIVYGVSTCLIYLWIPIYSWLSDLPYNGTVGVIYPTFSFWAIVLITTAIAIGPKWLITSFNQSFFPEDKDIIREAWITGQLKRELGIQHRYRLKKK
nr:phospholipid-translocating ATPase [Cryptococcus depauperatus CBS 7841]